MIAYLFHTFFYNPIYNLLVFLVHLAPGGDVGLAVLIITIFIRLLLLPFSLSAARTQQVIGGLEPKLNEIKELHKNDKAAQAEKTMALYREAQINPFSSIITVVLQIPILLALYLVFRYEAFPNIDTHILYTFVTAPTVVSMKFLGLINIAGKSVILAALAGITQYIQATLALSRVKQPIKKNGATADFSRMMGTQMRFVFPFIITAIAYSTGGAIALYFVTTNTFGSFQELYVRRSLAHEAATDSLEDKKTKAVA
ncbi:MAG: hypothetical protein B7X04_02705 [Parcubacteria group bacterium 21-54-25]|nr:MAG: hypothetical protein B7X04_02705 [Parcubacteria group bacterium 21-54-25]HQU07737.1 YidC/Oxa1 family membrane protein insertase [Candidatus Paceibacterota bacterium]